MDFYSDIIFDHYKNPRNQGILKNPTHRATAVNAFCGDAISVQLRIADNKIREIKYEATGCAVSIAAMSLLSDAIKGRTIGEIREIREIRIQKLLGIELTPTRLKCALLGLTAIKKALNF